MKKYIASCLLIFGLLLSGHIAQAQKSPSSTLLAQVSEQDTEAEQTENSPQSVLEPSHEDSHGHAPGWLVIPFVALLLMIATGPLFYEHFWHHNYPKIAVSLATVVVLYYLFVLHNVHNPVHALAEYVQFIALLASLFIASGGILIEVDKNSTPLANVILLLIGALISNLIGTTGASMLLIRPFIRLNKHNIQPYHIIFFIFMVSNIGGSLTPIGDPPLFLGFLKGVPFFWTLEHNWPAWILALAILSIIFYFVDKKFGRNGALIETEEENQFTNKISLSGTKNFFWLLLIIISVFLDPNVLDWVPAIHYDGQKFSFLRETIMFSVAFFSYKFADQKALQGNEFNFEPIREVAFIFIGIFGTMMPALELVGTFAQSEEGAAMITYNSLYWGTGILSGFLDNAPTYLNFLAAAMASQGADINIIQQVKDFAMDNYLDSAFELMAISIASVFFGAMTYIGNGPNFMVKSIAEQSGIKMPSFFGYILRFSIPILLPILFITWLVFFAFAG
ncbi:Na+/H+ antiporter NhaD [Cyclobacterium lianum]|uniref:Na+/H+ antiporter NhaD n=1 Tax=Cyclobacterium lianum TaxID=388280 RepID=A0A1M7K6M3_9BACT|nr:sodium:proton antiporter [Cyclobacterium lianum]SHM60906.1 Na+/H+ antiporter NhaD [Cyclobacterium lianum]